MRYRGGARRPTGRNAGNLSHNEDASPQARAGRAFARKDPASFLPVLSGPGCWCGEPFGHDWPGKADGAPHPREDRTIWQDPVGGGRS